MPRCGSIVFGELIGKLEMLRVTCPKCGRDARYSVLLLNDMYGRDGNVTDWLNRITADCPRQRSLDMTNQCGATMPDLAQAL